MAGPGKNLILIASVFALLGVSACACGGDSGDGGGAGLCNNDSDCQADRSCIDGNCVERDGDGNNSPNNGGNNNDEPEPDNNDDNNTANNDDNNTANNDDNNTANNDDNTANNDNNTANNDDNTANNDNNTANNDDNDGLAGAPCSSDADCGANMRCLQSFMPGPTRYCAPRCEVATWGQDCLEFVRSSFNIRLPDEIGASYNDWNSDVLWRVPDCNDLTNAPAVGAPDGSSYCIWVCPENAAGVYNDRGGITACSCLPHHRKTRDNPMTCEWNNDPPYDCSLFESNCTVTNTNVGECSAGDFRCVLMESLEGPCVDFVSGEQIEECVARCSWDCDTDCISDRCQGAGPDCIDQCCQSDDPECN